MTSRTAFAAVCILSVATPLRAQNRAERLAHFRAFAESTVAAQGSWSSTGALVGGVGGGVAFAAAFYHFTHRDGLPNNTDANLGGALVGAAFGAATGALAGAFIGSLFPKRAAAP